MQEVPKLSAAVACDLAGIDRDRLNEAIARGDYPCAPETRPGSRRLFDEDEFVALSVYGAMIHRHMAPHFSGAIACHVLSAIRLEPAAKVVALLWRYGGVVDAVTPDLDWAEAQLRVPTSNEIDSGSEDALTRAFFPIVSMEKINVASYRAKFHTKIWRMQVEARDKSSLKELPNGQ